MSLESSTDNVVHAALILAVGAVNSDLQTIIGQDAIKSWSVAPVPVSAIERSGFPRLNVWRLRDREDSPSDYDYQERTTIRFDYYVEPTMHGKYFDRWSILRAVYGSIYKNLKLGQHPNVSNNLPVLHAANVARYELNTANVSYLFAADGGGQLTFPSFQAQMDFIVWSDPPEGLVTPDQLADFQRLLIDWQLVNVADDEATQIAQLTTAPEAQDDIELET